MSAQTSGSAGGDKKKLNEASKYQRDGNRHERRAGQNAALVARRTRKYAGTRIHGINETYEVKRMK